MTRWKATRDWVRTYAAALWAWLRALWEKPSVSALVIAIVSASVSAVFTHFLACRVITPPPEIAELIHAEAKLAREVPRDEKAYLQLFTEDAVVFETGTSRVWIGRGQIRERFRTLPPFNSLSHDLKREPEMLENGRAAKANTRTTFTSENKSHEGSEEWFFKKVDEGWRIAKLFY